LRADRTVADDAFKGLAAVDRSVQVLVPGAQIVNVRVDDLRVESIDGEIVDRTGSGMDGH
jgi:hypothetical protein